MQQDAIPQSMVLMPGFLGPAVQGSAFKEQVIFKDSERPVGKLQDGGTPHHRVEFHAVRMIRTTGSSVPNAHGTGSRFPLRCICIPPVTAATPLVSRAPRRANPNEIPSGGMSRTLTDVLQPGQSQPEAWQSVLFRSCAGSMGYPVLDVTALKNWLFKPEFRTDLHHASERIFVRMPESP